MVDPIIGKGLEGIGGISPKPGASNTPSADGVFPFKDLLERSIQQVNAMQQASDQAKADLVTGGAENFGAAMVEMKKAELAFQQLVEIRNKLVDAYQEVMRMQV